MSQILKGHDAGILSLSWCLQDNDLLLSCGMDNRNICWNPQTGESLGEFPIVTNWTFETRWNPSNPSFIATASFDGKIAIQALQNTNANSQSHGELQASDDADFFNQSQQQPQNAGFSLGKPPKWLQRPCGVNFGFGGKIITFADARTDAGVGSSSITINPFAPDEEVASSTANFERAMDAHNLVEICRSRIVDAHNEEQRADWEVIETLTAHNPRTALAQRLGFSSVDDGELETAQKSVNGESEQGQDVNSRKDSNMQVEKNRLSAFFDDKDHETFLTDVAATKATKTNSPFLIFTGSESSIDKRITRALLLGKFEAAVDATLEEDRLSEAFAIAVCGGQNCIEKVQKAYFRKQSSGPNYLRLLASIASKNLWDTVYNADLANWKEVMAALCCYATPGDFSDLCEALGDRLDEEVRSGHSAGNVRKDASFCYLAGSRLEKVVDIWIKEMHAAETAQVEGDEDSPFAIHVRCLRNFIEKVSVFRDVTRFDDPDKNTTAGFKLASLYDQYIEYADILAANGQLQAASKYLNLLPSAYPAAGLTKDRVQLATQKAKVPTPAKAINNTNAPQGGAAVVASAAFQGTQPRSQTSANPYPPAATGQASSPYAPSGAGAYNGASYPNQQLFSQHQSKQQLPGHQLGTAPPPSSFGSMYQNPNGPPPRNFSSSPSVAPPSQAKDMTNWNDTPASFFKPPPPRRSTPVVAQQGTTPALGTTPAPSGPVTPPYGAQPRATPPLGPPPKGPVGPPFRNFSPSIALPQTQQQQTGRPSSSAANAYAPLQPLQASSNNIPPPQRPPIPRGPSPYNAPPSGPPPSNRYAPNPSTQLSQTEQPPPPSVRQGPTPPNPYVSPSAATLPQRPPSQPSIGPPPGGPPRQPAQGRPPSSGQTATQLPRGGPPIRKYRE